MILYITIMFKRLESEPKAPCNCTAVLSFSAPDGSHGGFNVRCPISGKLCAVKVLNDRGDYSEYQEGHCALENTPNTPPEG